MTATQPAADPVPPNDLDALRVPREAILPVDPITRARLEAELDHWWHRLTTGQRMTIHLEYDA